MTRHVLYLRDLSNELHDEIKKEILSSQEEKLKKAITDGEDIEIGYWVERKKYRVTTE